ncbi:MAG: hypothetical protein RIQ60_3985 [Pseudomonadota bacterium]|jgi:hypothetical protein
MVFENVAIGVALLGLTGVLIWAATRHYRSHIARLVHELEEARAAAAHHALWSEEQRIEQGRQMRALQSQVARLEAQMQNEQKRATRGGWSLPIATPGSTAAAAGPQMRTLNLAATIPGITPNRPLVTIEGGRNTIGGTTGGSSPAASRAERDLAELAAEVQAVAARAREPAETAGRDAVSTSALPTTTRDDGKREPLPQVAGNASYFSKKSGKLTMPPGGITTSTELDFAATQPIDVREIHGS